MGNKEEPKRITSFRDLEVYRNSYQLMLIVHGEILSALPESEKYDLKDQLSRSSKAIPRLIAEGYGKRHQKAGFQKYLDDAMSESNETAVSIEQARDLYSKCNQILCDDLVKRYDVLGRQLFKLSEAWSRFKDQRHNPLTKQAS